MIIRELIKKLVENSLTIQNYLLLNIINSKDVGSFYSYLDAFGIFYDAEDLKNLEDLGFMKKIDPSGIYSVRNLVVTDKFLGIFNEFLGSVPQKGNSNSGEVESWFEDWYNLFPRGIKSGGYMVRGDKRGCLNKLKKFTIDYPEFDKEIIMKATKEYVEECKKNKYQYMMLAHYFISKHRVSSLAGYCELIVDRENNPEEIEKSLKEGKIGSSEEWDFLKDI